MLQITTDEWGNKTKDEFNIASSSASPYTPLYNYFDNYHVEDSDIYLYHKPTVKKQRYASTFNSSNFYQRLNYSLDFERYKLSRTNETEIFVSKGCIYDADEKLLLMLSCKAGSTIEFARYVSPTKENAKNLTLFISTELLLNPTYNLFYKNLDKSYIKEAFMIDLPVIYTTSDEIERLHYSNDFKVEFNQISDFENHLKNNVGRIFKMSNEDFETFNPGIGKDFQEVIPVPEVEELLSGSGARVLQQVFDESFREQFVTGSSNIRISNDGTLHSIPAFTDDGSQLSIGGTGEIRGIVSPTHQLHIPTSEGTINVYDHTVSNYIIGMDPYLSNSVVAPPISNIQEVVQHFDFVDDTEDSVEF